MIFGKTLRVFAATLVFTSSISFAGEGTGNDTQSKKAVPPGITQDPSALFVADEELPPKDITLPDGTHTPENVELISATANTPEQLQSLIKLGSQTLDQGRSEGATIIPFDVDPDEESRTAMATITAGENHTADAPATEVRLPKNWD